MFRGEAKAPRKQNGLRCGLVRAEPIRPGFLQSREIPQPPKSRVVFRFAQALGLSDLLIANCIVTI